MISNNGMASVPAQKRTAPTLQPSKRINIVDGENSDPLGYSEPTAHDSIEARGARARHSMKQMIEQQKQYDKNMELLEEMKKKKKAEASK